MDIIDNKRKYIALFMLYAMLAISFLSSLASNVALPRMADLSILQIW